MVLGACLAMTLAGTAGVDAQTSRQEDDALIGECRSLFAGGMFSQAGLLLDKVSAVQGLASDQEVDFMKAVIAANRDIAAAKPLLESFLQKYGGSLYADRVLAYYAESCIATRDFEKALSSLEECDMLNITETEKRRADLNYAIALFRCGRVEEGRLQLAQCGEDCPRDMKTDWLFYKGYSAYQNGQYEEAQSFFSQSLDGSHQQEARLYLAQIANDSGQNAAFDALDMKELAETDADSLVSLEAMRLLGENRFMNGDKRGASDILLEYIDKAGDNVLPRDRYLAGLALFEQQEWDAVIDCLAPVSELDGELAQSAALYMGLAALNNGDRQMAGISFQRASLIPGRDDVREQALYNYSMLLHESQAAPFGDAVQAMELFLNDYPNSDHVDMIMQCLIVEYERTNNYEAALSSISRIKNPGGRILDSKQKLLMYKAFDEFSKGNYEQSASLLTDADRAGTFDAARTRELLFWRAESYYRLNQTEKAESEWMRLSVQSPADDALSALTNYGLAYIAFNRGSYADAADRMRKALAVKDGLQQSFAVDANLRLADCQLNLRQYSESLETYQKVLSTDKERGDYALAKSAAVNGLMQRNSEKIACLKRLLNDYPNSQYVPQALFDLGTTYQQTNDSKNAIEMFQRVVKSYPSLDLSRRAAVETALAYYRMEDYDNAIRMYRQTVIDYPGSSEAMTALEDLRSIYVEMGNANAYIDFTKAVGGFAVLKPDQSDTLTYEAAFSMYGKGETAAALKLFEDYLSKYPDAAFKADALYYSATIHENDGNEEKAIDCYLEASGAGNSRYSTDALSKAASLAYSIGDWATSMDLYIRLNGKASDPDLRETCAERIVLSAGQLQEYDAVMEFYDQAVKGKSGTQSMTKVRYYKAKALMARSDKGQELHSLLESLSADTRSEYGAECDYLLSQLLYDEGNASAAQDNVMELMSQGTPHLYWLSRSLILLSDILKEQGKETEARQYLLSLKSNYSGNDDISDMIEERLNK